MDRVAGAIGRFGGRIGLSANPGRILGGALLACAMAVYLGAGAASSAAGSATAPLGPEFGLASATNPVDPPSTSEFQTMYDAGVRSYRAYFAWVAVQKSPGAFDWTITDRQVGDAAAAGVRTVPFLYGTPGWVSGCVQDNLKCASVAPVRTPAERTAWSHFAGAVAARYGPGGSYWSEHSELTALPIEAWEIWDEENLGHYYAPAPSPAAYARLLKVSSRALRRQDPLAQVVVGGLAPGKKAGNMVLDRFLDGLYAVPGVKKLFDGVAIHPYAGKLKDINKIVARAHRSLKRHRDSAPIWITEIGWSSNPGNGAGLKQGVQGQKNLVRQTFKSFARNGHRWNIAAVYYWAWRDVPGSDQRLWGNTAGMMRSDLTAKPSWTAFEQLMQAQTAP